MKQITSNKNISNWRSLPLNELLEMKIKHLDLQIAGGPIERYILNLYSELEAKKIRLRPHVWISDSWFCPDGVAGFAIPFYLLDRRLKVLERKYSGHIEGGDSTSLKQLLRHETGHAMDNAYGLRKNKRRQKLFGLSSLPYPDSFTPNPYSKDFVEHLESNYAQAHPDEDWAETFATWVAPRSNWKKKYPTGKVREKLELTEALIKNIQGKKVSNLNRSQIDSYKQNELTLKEYFVNKRAHSLKHANYFATPLNNIFTPLKRKTINNSISAVKFIRTHQREFCYNISRNTSQNEKTIKVFLDEMIMFCKENRLKLNSHPLEAKVRFLKSMTKETNRYLKNGKFKVVM